jgi:Concanavalin A-like lectin/glucanases superfamily
MALLWVAIALAVMGCGRSATLYDAGDGTGTAIDAMTADGPPDTILSEQPPAATASTTARFAFHAAPDAPDTTFNCQVDGGAAASCTSPFARTVTEGPHTFAVAATDRLGHTDATPATASWAVDLTPPTVMITGGPPALGNDPTPTFMFTTGGEPTTIECHVDAAAFAACTSPFTSAALADGAHTFEVRVADAAGNSASASRPFALDLVKPTVVIDTPTPPARTKSTAATFMFHSSSDPGATFECALDLGAFAACSSGKAYSGLAGGQGFTHKFRVHAIDAVKNVGDDALYSWVVDTVPPTVTIDSAPADPTKDTKATFVFHSSEDPGVTFACTLDGATSACATGKSYAGLAGGVGTQHTFSVSATDTAGNAGPPASLKWIVDTVAPDTTLGAHPDAVTPSTSATMGYTSADAGATFQCTLDGVMLASCPKAGTALSSLAATSHTFAVAAVDPAGNVDASPPSWTWLVDPRAPTVKTAPPAGWPVNYFTFAFDGPQPGLAAQYFCSVNGGAYAKCGVPATITVPIAKYDQMNTLTVQWRDSKGAASAASPPVTWTPHPGLVLYYPLDGDSKNRSVLRPFEGHDGAGGTVAATGGVAGGAVRATASVALTDSSRPLTSAAQYTIAMWVLRDNVAPAEQGTLLDLGTCKIKGDAAGAVSITCTGLTGAATGTVPLEKWTHIALRYSGTGQGAGKGGDVELLVDGTAVSTLANPTKIDLFGAGQLASAALGDSPAGGASTWRIDEVRIFNTALASLVDPALLAVLPADLDYDLDRAPPVNSGASTLSTVATFTPIIKKGVYGPSLAVPKTGTLAAAGLGIVEGDGHTVALWFYDDGTGNSGTLFNLICPGLPGCDPLSKSGLAATIAGAKLTVCANEGSLPAPLCESGAYATKQWHLLLVEEYAHPINDGAWVTDGVDATIDGALVARINLTDQSSEVFGRPSTRFEMSPMMSAAASGVYLDEVKLWGIPRFGLSTDVQCIAFDGSTWDYAASSCTRPSPPAP